VKEKEKLRRDEGEKRGEGSSRKVLLTYLRTYVLTLLVSYLKLTIKLQLATPCSLANKSTCTEAVSSVYVSLSCSRRDKHQSLTSPIQLCSVTRAVETSDAGVLTL